MNCPHCRAPLVEGARFCPACGKATAPTESGSSWQAMGGAPDMAGKEIAGRYRIQKKLGEGGMGAVYRGEQISLKRTVAVKLLRPELGSNQMILQRFNAEAHAVAKLSHPNTVNIFDFGQDSDGSLFIAMEFIEGRSLREAIQKEGPFPMGRALAIAQQVAASLSDAHAQGIVHRDLKPDNVMLQDRGKQKDVVRVLDFGIAKLRDDNRATQQAMTQAGDMLGTPQYMAPEQIRGEQIDGRTDIYALGCMIYEMVTGRMPYEAPTVMAMLSKHLLESPVPPTQRRPELGLPASIDHLVAVAMAKDPNGRPATMDQFSDMIAGLQAQLPGDPNRSAGLAPMGAMSAMGPVVTPPAFQPPTPPPMGGAQYGAPAGYAPTPAPPSYQQVSPTTAIPQAKSKAPLFALLGVLAVGGGAAGIYFATKGDDKPKAAVTTPDKPTTPDPTTPDPVQPDPDDEPDDPPDPDDGKDPWADKGQTGKDPWANGKAGDPTQLSNNVGTAATPIPRGASLVPPPGFTQVQNDANGIGYVHKKRNLAIAMVPLYAGTNDPEELAEKWTADTGATFIQKDTGFSAGTNRDILLFSHTVEGVQVIQAVVLYITSTYRLGVIYQVPLSMATDEKLEKEIDAFFYNNVKLPATLRQ